MICLERRVRYQSKETKKNRRQDQVCITPEVKVIRSRQTQNGMQIQVGPGNSGLRKNFCARGATTHGQACYVLHAVPSCINGPNSSPFTLSFYCFSHQRGKLKFLALWLWIWPCDLLWLVSQHNGQGLQKHLSLLSTLSDCHEKTRYRLTCQSWEGDEGHMEQRRTVPAVPFLVNLPFLGHPSYVNKPPETRRTAQLNSANLQSTIRFIRI